MYVALLHFYTKTLSAICAGELGVKHHMKISTYVLISIVLLLAGCSYEIKLSAEVNTDCSVDVMFENESPQIRYITVAEAVGDKFDYKEPVWEINGNLRKISKFTYGSLPEGLLLFCYDS